MPSKWLFNGPVHPDVCNHASQTDSKQHLWIHCAVSLTLPSVSISLPRLITAFLAFSLVKNCLSRSTVNKLQRKCGQCYRKACRDENGHVEQCDICKLQDWLRNYHLADTDAFTLFNEFLEMGKPLLSFSSPLLFALLCTGSYNFEICSFLFLYTPVWGNICHNSSHRKVSTHSRKMPLVALEQKAWKILLIP